MSRPTYLFFHTQYPTNPAISTITSRLRAITTGIKILSVLFGVSTLLTKIESYS